MSRTKLYLSCHLQGLYLQVQHPKGLYGLKPSNLGTQQHSCLLTPASESLPSTVSICCLQGLGHIRNHASNTSVRSQMPDLTGHIKECPGLRESVAVTFLFSVTVCMYSQRHLWVAVGFSQRYVPGKYLTHRPPPRMGVFIPGQ